MATDLFDRMRVIDVDTHLTEPPDVWTARLPASRARRGAAHRAHRRPRRVDGRRRAARRARATTRWPASTASCPRRSRRPSTRSTRRCTTPKARLAFLDARGHRRPGALPERRRLRQRLLPAPRRPRARRACVRAYNDFLTDWCSAAPDRLLAVTALPFWDVDLADRRDAALHRQRPPGHQLLQPAAGPRPAAARAPALGSDLGGRAGGRRAGELPRRRRLDGHPVRRRRRAWAG